jgi:hypothetical protein
MPPKGVLKTLTISDKYKLLKDVESGIRKKDVAAKFNIPASTVSTILKKRAEIIKVVENAGETCTNNKRLKKPTYENVDKLVLDWFKVTREKNVLVSGAMVKQKAPEFAHRLKQENFKASNGWITNWQKRLVFSLG